MSDQQTTANTPKDPVLCKMGCGFFGNEASEGCCSKCFREILKKEEAKSVEKVQQAAAAAAPAVCPPAAPAPMEDVIPMEVEETPAPAPVVEPAKPPAAVAPSTQSTTPKKKKKASYKNMMSGMMKKDSPRDAEKQKEQIRKVTGGGAFSKIEKI